MKNKIVQTFLVLSLNSNSSPISKGNRLLSAISCLFVLAFAFLSMPAASVSFGLIAFVFLVIPFDF